MSFACEYLTKDKIPKGPDVVDHIENSGDYVVVDHGNERWRYRRGTKRLCAYFRYRDPRPEGDDLARLGPWEAIYLAEDYRE